MCEFPDWAPKSLADFYSQERERKQSSWDDQDDEFCEKMGWCRHGSRLDVEEARQEAEMLCRMVTQPDMKQAWQAIYRHPASDAIPRNLASQDPAEALWIHLKHFVLPEFRRTCKRTAQAKKRALKRAAANARKLIAEIRGDLELHRTARSLVGNYVGTEHMRYLSDVLGEARSNLYFQMPSLELRGDASDARRYSYYTDDDRRLWGFETSPEARWSNQKDEVRFAYWTSSLEELSFIDLLEAFAETVELNAAVPPAIKQPGRADSALKLFLIRKISEWMQWFYGTPLDDSVARIVTALLDLDPPLTRDDVRPYRGNNG